MTRRRLATTPPLPPDIWLRPPSRPPVFPLDAPACRLCSSAADGLRLGLQALALLSGDEVLIPVHHDRALVEQVLCAGLGVAYYGCGTDGTPDEAELERATTRRTRAMMLVHALGVAQDAVHWRGFCAARGWILLEDATQAWPAALDAVPAGATGELAVFSFAESLGLPGVAAVLCRLPEPLATHGAPGRGGRATAAVLQARWFAQRAALAGAARWMPAGERRCGFAATARDAGCAPPTAALALLARLADRDIAAARRANHAALLEALGDTVPEPWRRIDDGAAPSVFPVELSDAVAVGERLRGLGIGTRDVWSLPHPSLDAKRTAGVLSRRASSLGLPVHQELRPRDVERIAAAVGGRRRRAELRVEPLTSLEAARAECEPLSASGANIFTTFEWMSAWCRHLRDGEVPRLVACRDAGGNAVGLLALVTRREHGLRVVRLLGHGPADRLAPICAPHDRSRVAAALRRALHDSGCDLFVGEQMPADEGWGPAIGATVLEREASPVLHIGGIGWEEFLARRSANFRQQVRRRERRLARGVEMRYRLADDPARLTADVDTLMELHDARWRAGGSTAFAGSNRDLHREFAAQALARGWLRLWLLEIDGRAVAAWYGFRYGGAEWFYQSGRDMSAGGDAVGFVLLCHTIREAMNDGMREYRLLRGDEGYKGRFADRDPGLQTVALALSTRGRAALTAQRARPVAGRVVRRVRAARTAT